MNDGSGEKEIVPQDQTRNKNIPPSAEAMNLVSAKRILQTAASIPANSFTETSDSNRVGEYSMQQILTAAKVICENLMDVYGGKTLFGYKRQLSKEVPEGRTLWLAIYHGDEASGGKYDPNMETINLSLKRGNSGWGMISNGLLLTENPIGTKLSLIGFYDYRPEKPEVVSLSKIQHEGGTIDDIRTMWKGLQWTAVNMLNWDQPSVIMPEELAGQSSRIVEGNRSPSPAKKPDNILRTLLKKVGVK